MFKNFSFKKRSWFAFVTVLVFLGGWDAWSMEDFEIGDQSRREHPLSRKEMNKKWLAKANKQLALAQYKVGLKYLMNERYYEALNFFKKAKINGHPEAQERIVDAYNNIGAEYYKIGSLYYKRNCVDRALECFDEASHYFEKAVREADPETQVKN